MASVRLGASPALIRTQGVEAAMIRRCCSYHDVCVTSALGSGACVKADISDRQLRATEPTLSRLAHLF